MKLFYPEVWKINIQLPQHLEVTTWYLLYYIKILKLAAFEQSDLLFSFC